MKTPYPDRFNMAAHVLAQADNLADKPALQVLSAQGAETLTYAALKAAVLGTATGLKQKGLNPGARVLMRLGNTPDFPVAYLGALAAGLVPIPTAAALTEAEVASIIRRVDPDVILRDPGVPCPLFEQTVSIQELRSMRVLPPAQWHWGDANRPGYIIFTSGTSGRSTPVLHAHRAILARQMMFDGWYGLQRDDRLFHAGAFNWTYTLGTGLMDPWTIGATALIAAPGTSAQELPALLARHQATIFAAAPGVYRQMLKASHLPVMPHMRHGLSAGEKLPDATRAAWLQQTGKQIYEAFGMSECSTFISGCPAHPATTGAIGRPQPGRNVAIIGDDGPLQGAGAGTIAIHKDDPGLMLGYLDAPDHTADRFSGDWFLTGDQAEMTENGDIVYLGRADDMMNAGGFRVSPLEVESALAAAPGITGIGVTEVRVRADATVIAAFYTSQTPLDAAALERYAQVRLARYKQPRLYIHLPTLPIGANGKLQRKALRDIYEASAHGTAKH